MIGGLKTSPSASRVFAPDVAPANDAPTTNNYAGGELLNFCE
jgi:hypothetical protein